MRARIITSVVCAVLLASGMGVQGGDWPRLLGPNHDCRAAKEDVSGFWSEGGLKKEWEFPKGKGWAAPTVVGERVLLFHRQERQEVLECLDLKSGKSLWRVAYDAPYRDRYGSGDGSRSGSVVVDDKVWIFGITGLLHCIDLKDGRIVWKRDLGADYAMQDNFFGHGSTPLVIRGRVLMPVGGSQQRCVVALDAATGEELWVTKHEWGAGYASAIPARFGKPGSQKECVLLFTGGGVASAHRRVALPGFGNGAGVGGNSASRQNSRVGQRCVSIVSRWEQGVYHRGLWEWRRSE